MVYVTCCSKAVPILMPGDYGNKHRGNSPIELPDSGSTADCINPSAEPSAGTSDPAGLGRTIASDISVSTRDRPRTQDVLNCHYVLLNVNIELALSPGRRSRPSDPTGAPRLEIITTHPTRRLEPCWLTIYSFRARSREQMQDIPFSVMNTRRTCQPQPQP